MVRPLGGNNSTERRVGAVVSPGAAVRSSGPRFVAPRRRYVELAAPTDLFHSLRLHRFGKLDPTFRLAAGGLERAVHTPDGPGVIRIETRDRRGFEVQAWGPGRAWLLDRSLGMLGVDDGSDRFRPDHPRLRRMHRGLAGLRLCRSPTVFETFVTVVLQQRVAWRDAVRSFLDLVRSFAEPAPQSSLRCFPAPAVFRDLDLARYRWAGVDAQRARTLIQGATSWRRLEALADRDPIESARRLQSLPGVGVWTSQSVLGFGLGWADAVPAGDHDLPRLVGAVLADEPRADDARMLELLAPFRGHRWRVIRLLHESGVPPPRFGPRRGPGVGPAPGRRGDPRR
ncbi:MAG TPA: hypothetical protein RMG48_00460 [Myxococcales bacterium LLY-WYZ-16_1]|nr:hypothetical protein [Myxococcales bacterium LLY-WYZ-16_1]